MPNLALLLMLEKSIGEFNAWRKKHPEEKLDFSRAELSRKYLCQANLSGVNLCKADLSRAYLSWTNLSGANLFKAYLPRVRLIRADLSEANLSGVNLYRAELSGANLSRANLFEADLFRARLYMTNLSGVNLYRAELSGTELQDSLLDPKQWVPPLQRLWQGASKKRQTALVRALQDGKILYGKWREGDLLCPEAHLLRGKEKSSLFTAAWNTGGLTPKQVLDVLV